MKISETRESDKIILSVEGKIDTTTSPELQNAILLSLQKMSNLVINLEKVSYVSSAGLRSFLVGHKTASSKGGYMVLTNVNSMVMEVLEITGFINILKIQK